MSKIRICCGWFTGRSGKYKVMQADTALLQTEGFAQNKQGSSLSSKTRYSEATEKFLSRMMLNQILSSKAIGINLKAKWNYSAHYYRATTTVTPSQSTNRKQTAPFSWYLHFVKQYLYISSTTVHQQGWTNSLRQHSQTVHLSSKLLKRFEKFSACFYLSSNSFWTQTDLFNSVLCKKCLLSPETSQAFLFRDEPLHPYFFYAPNTLVFGPGTSFPTLNVPKKNGLLPGWLGGCTKDAPREVRFTLMPQKCPKLPSHKSCLLLHL